MKKLIPIILICFLMGACSFHMEKRRYFKGFHISITQNRGQSIKLANKKKLHQSGNQVNHPEVPEFMTASQTQQRPKANTIEYLVKPLTTNASRGNFVYPTNITVNKDNQLKEITNKNSGKHNFTSKEGNNSKATISTTKNKSRTENFFMLLSGAFVAAFSMAFKPFIAHTKKIGYWALNNRKIARGLHFVAHCGLASCGYYLGQRCYDAGLESTELTSYGLAGAATVITALYPHRKAKTGFFKNTYLKQKMFSMFMVLTGMMMFVNIGNRVAADNISFPLANKFVNLNMESNLVVHGQNEIASNDTPKDDQRGAKIALTVVTAVVSLLLCVLIIGGSCAIACSGQEGLAGGLLLFGLPTVIILSVYIFKSIWKDEMNERKKINKEQPAPKIS